MRLLLARVDKPRIREIAVMVAYLVAMALITLLSWGRDWFLIGFSVLWFLSKLLPALVNHRKYRRTIAALRAAGYDVDRVTRPGAAEAERGCTPTLP